jgi:hypothetical protein
MWLKLFRFGNIETGAKHICNVVAVFFRSAPSFTYLQPRPREAAELCISLRSQSVSSESSWAVKDVSRRIYCVHVYLLVKKTLLQGSEQGILFFYFVEGKGRSGVQARARGRFNHEEHSLF